MSSLNREKKDSQIKLDKGLEFLFKLVENFLLSESEQYVPKYSYNLK